ncbi:hypothetical protein [Rhodococcus opacus]|uniref:hypothetical protein n=1 Tax=Rhodococcus opacus TaxID=37919 RepID=UPI001C47F442|nr:hypothetical protein [Rhodococcus opacus]MBV6759916.1 hypothetical protein [Rhodococcus opacus]
MSSILDTVREWINPGRVRHRSVPRMETGLRPNLRLDEAEELLAAGVHTPDDITVTADGTVILSSGCELLRVERGGIRLFARCAARIAAVTTVGNAVVAAVEGTGLVTVDASGAVTPLCADPAVARGVTALTGVPAGDLLVTVGSTTADVRGDWARALLAGDASGRIVRVRDGAASVVAEGLAWPSGIALSGDGQVIVATSLTHRLEIRSLNDPSEPVRSIATNLPVYPGRIVAVPNGHWVVAPYPRNRITEMLLDERSLLSEMVETIDREEWFVPQLRSGNLFTEAMQMGQLRVFGQVKSWAPARSCGVLFRLDDTGRITESAHARVDSPRHGVTGVAVADGRVVTALQGHGSVLRLHTDEIAQEGRS